MQGERATQIWTDPRLLRLIGPALSSVGLGVFVFGYVARAPGRMAVAVALLATGLLADLALRIRATFIALPFVAAFCLFLLGRLGAHQVLGYPAGDQNRFGMPFNRLDVEVHVFVVLALALTGLTFGFALLGRGGGRWGGRVARHRGNRRPSSWLLDIRRVSLICFAVSLPLQLYLDVRSGLYVSAHGYFDYYLNPPHPLPGVLRVLANAFNVSYLSFLATRPGRRAVGLATAAYLLEGVASLGTGQRQGFLLSVAIVVVYYCHRHFTDSRPWVSRRAMVAGLAAAPILLGAMAVVGRIRVGRSGSFESPLSTVADFLYAQGVSVNVIGYGFVYRAQIPHEHLYSLGPVTDLLLRRVPALLSLGPGVLQGQTVERATDSGLFAHQLAYLIDPIYYLRGGGFGSAYPAELWADFGYPGVFVGSLALALLVVGLTLGIRGPWAVALTAMVVAREVFLTPRSSPTQFVAEVVAAPTILGLILICLGTVSFRQLRGRVVTRRSS